MKHIHTRSLSDEELRPALAANDLIRIRAAGLSLRKIEQQIDRLGFGDLYIVSVGESKFNRMPTANLSPALAIDGRTRDCLAGF
jgi:hypothetical protein